MSVMIERIKRILSRLSDGPFGQDKPPDASDDREAGSPVRIRRGPPDRNLSVAVAEPDDDDE